MEKDRRTDKRASCTPALDPTQVSGTSTSTRRAHRRTKAISAIAVVFLACQDEVIFVPTGVTDVGNSPAAPVMDATSPDLTVLDAGSTDAGSVTMADTGAAEKDVGEPATDGGQSQDLGVVDDIPVASDSIYLHTEDELYVIEPSTDAPVLRGRFTAVDFSGEWTMTDLAIDRRGAVYGGATYTDPDGAIRGLLLRVNPVTADCTFVSFLDDLPTGLGFDGADRLWVAGRQLTIYEAPGQLPGQVLVTDSTYATSGDVVGLPDGFVYWSVDTREGGTEAPDRLIRVDPMTGETISVGSLPMPRVLGLSYANGELYAFSYDQRYATIDPATGRTLRTFTSAERWLGAATNPIVW